MMTKGTRKEKFKNTIHWDQNEFKKALILNLMTLLKQAMEFVTAYPFEIQYMMDPPEELCLAAVRKDGQATSQN